MHDDDSDALHCLLEYLYTMKCPRPLEHWDMYPRRKTALPLLLVKTYALADKYDLEQLMELVIDQCKLLFDEPSHYADSMEALNSLYVMGNAPKLL